MSWTQKAGRTQRARRFLGRPLRDQAFVLKSLGVVLAVRVALSTIGYRRLKTVLPTTPAAGAAPEAGSPPPRAVARVAWAVTLASRFVPRATCLTQALAGQVLLAREGYPSTIRVGARQSEAGEFLAHAWLLCGPTVVLGGLAGDLDRFAPLVDLENS